MIQMRVVRWFVKLIYSKSNTKRTIPMKGAQIKVQAIFPNVSSHGIVTHRSHVNILKTEQYHSFPISGREEIEILPNTNINLMEQKAANPFAWKCKREKKNQINTRTGNWLNEKRKKQKKRRRDIG